MFYGNGHCSVLVWVRQLGKDAAGRFEDTQATWLPIEHG